MTGPTGTSVLRRPFGLPVVLSLALHGLAVAALGTFPLLIKTPHAQNDGIKVDLVVAQPAPIVRPKPVLSKPVVKKAAAPKGAAAFSYKFPPRAALSSALWERRHGRGTPANGARRPGR